MISAIFSEIDKPIKISEGLLPVLTTNEVLINLKFASINHRDIWISQGKYARIKTGCVLGSDGAGIVDAAYGEANDGWVGKEVIINPNINWGNNEDVHSNAYEVLGMPTNGTFSNYIKVPVDRIFEKPAHLNLQEAAALPLGGLSAYRAVVKRGKIKPGQTVLINGVGGGVALFAMQMAIAAGGNVYVTSGSDRKIEKAISLGALGGFNYKNAEWSKDFKNQIGEAHLIIDSAGGEGFNQLLKIAAPGGKIVIYGGTRGNIPSVSPQIIFWKQLNILGSTMGSDSDFIEMLQLVNKNKLKPVIDTVFDLNRINDAFQYVNRSSQFGKVVLRLP